MRISFTCILVVIVLGGCGKSEVEIEKEKQAQVAAQKAKIEQEKKLKEQAEIKVTEDKVKYYLKDGDSGKFRNVIKNCGEVNAKNSWGAYSGFTRFIVRDDNHVTFENSDNAYLFDAMIKSFCSKEYLSKFPINSQELKKVSEVAAADAAASENFR